MYRVSLESLPQYYQGLKQLKVECLFRHLGLLGTLRVKAPKSGALLGKWSSGHVPVLSSLLFGRGWQQMEHTCI